MNSVWTVIRIESREIQSNDYGSPVRRRWTRKVRAIFHDKLLRSLRPSNLVGQGLPERMRSVGFAFLGLTAATGLALVAIFAQTGFPLLSPAPLPSGPSEPSSISKAVSLGRGATAVAPAQGAVAVPGSGRGQNGSPGAAGGSRRTGADDSAVPVSGAPTGDAPETPGPSTSPPPATAPAPAPTTTTTESAPSPAPVEVPVSSPGTGTKPDKSKAVAPNPSKDEEEAAEPEEKPVKTKPSKPAKAKPSKPAKPEAKPSNPHKPEAAPAPEVSYVPAPAPAPVDSGNGKSRDDGGKKNK